MFIRCIIFSSLSSGINAMSANTLQDILVNVLKDAVQYKKTVIAKLVGTRIYEKYFSNTCFFPYWLYTFNNMCSQNYQQQLKSPLSRAMFLVKLIMDIAAATKAKLRLKNIFHLLSLETHDAMLLCFGCSSTCHAECINFVRQFFLWISSD